MTAEEMKHYLGLKAREGDNRTLNKYVREGKLDINSLSRKVKMYRLAQDASFNECIKLASEDWIC